QPIKVPGGDQRAGAGYIAKHHSAAHCQSLKRASRFCKHQIVLWKKSFRIGEGLAALPAQHVKLKAHLSADFADGWKVGEATGIVAENRGALRSDRQTASRTKPFQINSVENDVHELLRDFRKTLQAAAAAAINAHVPQDSRKIHRRLRESTGSMAD